MKMNKVAVITGSSGGIGQALVETYISDGYFVFGLDKKASKSPALHSFKEITTDLIEFSRNSSYREQILLKINHFLPRIWLVMKCRQKIHLILIAMKI